MITFDNLTFPAKIIRSFWLKYTTFSNGLGQQRSNISKVVYTCYKPCDDHHGLLLLVHSAIHLWHLPPWAAKRDCPLLLFPGGFSPLAGGGIGTGDDSNSSLKSAKSFLLWLWKYENIRQWPVTDIGGWTLVNESSHIWLTSPKGIVAK